MIRFAIQHRTTKHYLGPRESSARKAASAAIAKIPLTLARHIAECYYPREASRLPGAPR